jgi:hypothetical protein
MIVKIDDTPVWENFAHRGNVIKAKKMSEDFMIETTMGWLYGKAGDYLVEVGTGIRFPCAGHDFLNSYRPFVERRSDAKWNFLERRRP